MIKILLFNGVKMDELRKLLHLIETDDVDEGLNIELKSHFAHPNPEKFKKGKQLWVIKQNKKPDIEFKNEDAFQDYFKIICIKAIAGFLNSQGGKLFIGVGDSIDESTGKRPIFGVNSDENFSRDKYKLNLLNYLNKFFTETYISKYLKIGFVSIGKPIVCVVEVMPIQNDFPVIIKINDVGERLYRRSDNRTIPVMSLEEIIQFGRDFWSRLENSKPDNVEIEIMPPNGWVGPYFLVSVDLDYDNKWVYLNLKEFDKPIICKFSNKFASLGAASKALIGKNIILTSTGRFKVESGYFSDIQKF